ncbi:MAG TPA: Arc family DNA-binding protein [Acetobacteraceae bacterium]|nr:Arc family DNA-binding protein [Acetobacteraceae bacterium]
MHYAGMRPEKSATPGITVRLPSPVRERVLKLARSEHRSAAAYIEHLVERDLRERDEADRLVRVHTAAGLPYTPSGEVTREVGETRQRHACRTAALDTLFGVR